MAVPEVQPLTDSELAVGESFLRAPAISPRNAPVSSPGPANGAGTAEECRSAKKGSLANLLRGSPEQFAQPFERFYRGSPLLFGRHRAELRPCRPTGQCDAFLHYSDFPLSHCWRLPGMASFPSPREFLSLSLHLRNPPTAPFS